jgi:Ribbon-helix-helix domain
MDEPVRWTVRVSKDTDVAVRTFLAQRGMKKGDLAKFIEEASGPADSPRNAQKPAVEERGNHEAIRARGAAGGQKRAFVVLK